jgi:SAM-dependent methyltransferase
MKKALRRIPILGRLLARLRARFFPPPPAPGFAGSHAFWEKRYRTGGNSGVGSYGKFGEFKAEVLNDFVARHRVRTVLDLGCGDGNQLTLARYPEYLGFDPSPSVIARCRDVFRGDPSKSFRVLEEFRDERADLCLSLDVIYHLIEDEVFERHLRMLFAAARRFVVIYSSNSEMPSGPDEPHVRHRIFTAWIERHAPAWRLLEHVPNRFPYLGDYRTGSFAEFFIFARGDSAEASSASAAPSDHGSTS